MYFHYFEVQAYIEVFKENFRLQSWLQLLPQVIMDSDFP